jgi:hypothetical protein
MSSALRRTLLIKPVRQKSICREWFGSDYGVADEAAGTKKPTPKKARPKDVSISKNSPALAKAETDSFIAEVFIKGMPSGANQTPSEKSEVVITTKGQDEKQSLDVTCLFCGKDIE